MPRWTRVLLDLDDRIVVALRRFGIPALRVALGVVFVWFGLLKVAGRSPVADLVAGTLPRFDPGLVVPLLGWWEVAVGGGLLAGVALRAVLVLFWAQMVGTFLVFLVQPRVVFQDGNPLLLTVEGEFILKNIVLVAAGLVVGGSMRRLTSQVSDRDPPVAVLARGLK